MDLNALMKSTLMLFAIINPIGSMPIFLQLTEKMKNKERNKAFNVAVIVALVILFTFILVGDKVLTNFFQIKIYDLMAAGGLLLLIIAIDHLLFGGLVKSVLVQENQDAHHIGAVPIACPILAGPGAMMTVLITFSNHGLLVAALSVLIVLGITFLILRFINTIYKVLGKTVCMVLSKILCLFLAAIGISLLMQGLWYYFK